MSSRFDPEQEYWDIYDWAFTDNGERYIQQPGNPSYVRQSTDSGGFETFIVNLVENDPFHPVRDYDKWKYAGIVRLHTKRITQAPPNYSAGDVLVHVEGGDDLLVPTYDEWSAMSAAEKAVYEQYYEWDESGSVPRALGIKVTSDENQSGEWYNITYYYGIVEEDHSQTYTEGGSTYYYNHVIFGSVASNYSAGSSSLSNPDGNSPVYVEKDFCLGTPWYIREDADYEGGHRYKKLVISAKAVSNTKYWCGFNSSGGTVYNTKSQNESVDGNDVVCDVHCFRQYIDGVHNGGYPYDESYKEVEKGIFLSPFPDYVWLINPSKNDGYPFLKIMDTTTGAFMNASNLVQVRVPMSVKSIGDHAFTNTALTSIKISDDCEYSETSFPENCTVEFYPGGSS